jgi:predicted metal-dependent peptidase
MAAARFRACKITPYFVDAIMSLIPMPSPGFGTFAVSEHGHLLFDPDVVCAWGVEAVSTVYIHEVQHVLRQHAHRARRQGVTGETSDAWGQAVDAEINDDLVAMSLPFPDGRCILPKNITKGAKDGLTAEEYFRMLPLDDQGHRQPNGNTATNGSGGTGVPLPQEPSTTGDGAVPGRTPADLDLIRSQCADKVQKAKNVGKAGSIPGGFLRWADEILKPPPYNWQRHLEAKANNVCAYVRGKKNRTFSQPSRRQGIFGYGDGVPIIAARRSPQVDGAVVLDTSASMDDEDLGMGLGILQRILSTLGSKVMFLSCDASVNTEMTVNSVKEAQKLMVGGGGTNFCPVFQSLEKKPPSVIFILTDGDGPAPEINILPQTEIVWVLIGDHAVIPYCQGAGNSTVPYGDIVWTSQAAQARNKSKEGNRKRTLPSVASTTTAGSDDTP